MSHDLKAGLLQFSHCKFHEHSLALDTGCWQVLFSKMTVLKVKEDLIADCKLIFLFSWYNMYVGLVANLSKWTQPLKVESATFLLVFL